MYAWEEEKLGEAFNAGLMKRLLRYVRPYWHLFAVAIGLSLVVTATDLALPYIFKLVIDQLLTPAVDKTNPAYGSVTVSQAAAGLTHYAILLIVIMVVRFFFAFGQQYVLQYSGQRVMYDMRTQIFSHVMRLPVKFFDKNPVGRLVTRATNDVAAINEMYSTVLVTAFSDVFLIVGILVIMFNLNWQLGALILILAPLIGYTTFEFRKRVRDAYREVRRKIAKLNAYLAENLSGVRITQIFVREARSIANFATINREEYGAQMDQLKIFAVFQPIISFMGYMATAIILWYGGVRSIEGLFTVGSLFVFLNYSDMLFQPIRDLSQQYNTLQSAMASSERIFILLDEPEEVYQGSISETSDEGRIEFRDVWFSYQSVQTQESDWVLRGVSFEVKPGERVAIVGPTGSGKTTIVSLILRLYQIQHGQILLDGVNVNELSLETIREKMAVVLQDVFLFSGDILGNIRLHEERIPEQEAISAARFVQADEFVNELEAGYETEVKERGSTLSVGQRQLLAFARAVAFDPRILILDEATANIDSRTESLIQGSIDRVLAGRTSIVIAHRLSTIRNSDKILVLEHGRLVEQGSHEELLAEQGLYHALYSLQFGETGPSSREQFEGAARESGDGDGALPSESDL